MAFAPNLPKVEQAVAPVTIPNVGTTGGLVTPSNTPLPVPCRKILVTVTGTLSVVMGGVTVTITNFPTGWHDMCIGTFLPATNATVYAFN